MDGAITIDHAGRLVIPKPLRDRLNLRPGTRLHIVEQDGRLLLTPDRPEPRLVERDGFLALDLGIDAAIGVDSRDVRDERLKQLVAYALRR
jgi:AbrB family looped-hinge helix DNA binding protein